MKNKGKTKIVLISALIFLIGISLASAEVHVRDETYISGENFSNVTVSAYNVTVVPSDRFINRTNVTVVPSDRISVIPNNFKSISWQGSKSSFDILIEETSDKETLDDVCFYIVRYIDGVIVNKTALLNQIPPNWVSFSKNNFTIPPGSQERVECTIRIPGDAKANYYEGLIVVDTSNDGYEFINLSVIVRSEVIPPKVKITEPENGAIYIEPTTITVKGYAEDNCGIDTLEIKTYKPPTYKAIPLAKERKRKRIEFEQEVQITEGKNIVRAIVKDYGGNTDRDVIVVYVGQAPIITPTLAPTPTPTPASPTPILTPTPTPTFPSPTPTPVHPGKNVTSKIKPIRAVYHVNVDKASKELVISLTLRNIGEEEIEDIYITMDTPSILHRTSLSNAEAKPQGLYIGDLNPGNKKTITQKFRLTGKVKEDLKILTTIKAKGSDLKTILVIVIIVSEALLKLIQYGIIPGFSVLTGIVGISLAIGLKKLRDGKKR